MLVYLGGGLSGLPFSRMAGYGSLLFLSGQVAIDRQSGRMEARNVEEQARVVLRNMQADLEQEGLSLQQVAKLTVYVKGTLEHAEALHAACEEAFAPARPAMTCVGVVRLPHPDALVEMELILHHES